MHGYVLAALWGRAFKRDIHKQTFEIKHNSWQEADQTSWLFTSFTSFLFDHMSGAPNEQILHRCRNAVFTLELSFLGDLKAYF